MRWSLIVLVAACGSRREAAQDAGPRSVGPVLRADAKTVTPVDAAPAVDAKPARKLHRGYKGFDFRAVPLDEETIGADEECVVSHVEKIENGFRVRCVSYGEASVVEVSGAERIEDDDVIVLRIEAAGERPVSARTRLVEKVGRLPEPEPPSRCCRDRDRDHPPGYEPPPLPEPYDFGRVWEDKAWGKDKVCRVTHIREIVKSDPTAERYKPEAAFDPADAAFVASVYCGNEHVLVGSRDYHTLLHLEDDSYIMLRLWHTGGHETTAMFRRTIHTER